MAKKSINKFAATDDKKAFVISEGKKALIAGVVSVILVTPLTLFIGYYLGQYLRAPHLKTQYANAIVEVEAPRFSGETLDNLKKNPRLGAELLFSPENYKGDGYPLDCDDWRETGQLYTDCHKMISDTIKRVLLFIRAKLSEWVQYKDKFDHSLDVFITPPIGFSPPDFVIAQEIIGLVRTGRKEEAARIIDERIRTIKTDLEAVLQFRQAFDSAIEKEVERTGKVFIRVGILNSGDSDGVIFPKAKLNFGDSELVMVADQYVVVKSHSFAEIEFVVNEDATSNAAMTKWRALVLKRDQEQFAITIDSSTQKISAVGRLPE